MKILHVLTAPRSEGTPRLVLDWISIKEHEQELLFLSPHGELRSEFEKNVNWQYYNSHFPLSVKNWFRIVNLVKNVCKERNPDIVISWPMGFSQWIHLGARLAGVNKLIVHAGNPPSKDFIGRYLYTYLSFWTGYFLGNKVIACSKYIKDEFGRIPFLFRSHFFYAYNCIDVKKFERAEGIRNDRQVTMVATLEKHKDHQTLLRACEIMENRGIPYNLNIAGDGSLKDELKILADDLNLKNVEFLGTRSNIPELLYQTNVFVLSTTRQEGFGTVLIEALASGCQVIATDVPACREVLQDGKYGTLVSFGNFEELAEALITCLNKKMGTEEWDRQKNYASSFSVEKMITKYVKIAEGVELSN